MVEEERPLGNGREVVEMEVMEGGMPGVEARDGVPNLTERTGVDARELASSTVNCSTLYSLEKRIYTRGKERQCGEAEEGTHLER